MTTLQNIISKASTYYMYPNSNVLREPLSWSVFKFNFIFYKKKKLQKMYLFWFLKKWQRHIRVGVNWITNMRPNSQLYKPAIYVLKIQFLRPKSVPTFLREYPTKTIREKNIYQKHYKLIIRWKNRPCSYRYCLSILKNRKKWSNKK